MSETDDSSRTDDADADPTPTPSTGDDAQEAVEADDDDLLTDDPTLRVAFWATLAAFLILSTFYILWGYLLFTGQTRPPYMSGVAYLGVLFALVWTFGQGTAATVEDLTDRLPFEVSARSER